MREEVTRQRLILLMKELARGFIDSGMVDPRKFRSLVTAIPDSAHARNPSLSSGGLENAVEDFLMEDP